MVRARGRLVALGQPALSRTPCSVSLTLVGVGFRPVVLLGAASHLPSRTHSPVRLETLSPGGCYIWPHVGFGRGLLLSEDAQDTAEPRPPASCTVTLWAGRLPRPHSPRRRVASGLVEVSGPQTRRALRLNMSCVICFDSLNISWQQFG